MFRKSGFLRPLLAVTTLAAAAVAHGQNINVTAANASNDAIYTVNFGNGTITVQNTDGGSLHSLRSLSFTTNPVNLQLDLLAADNAGGLIVRYCADFNTSASPAGKTTGTVVWNATQGGPSSPDGLSVDLAGNLFVVNQGSGTSTNPQVWVLTAPAQPAPGACQNFAFQNPVLIDSNYAAKETLEETLVVEATIPLPANQVCPPSGTCLNQISPGDLLVLTSNPASVLLYHQDGNNGQGPCTVAPCPTALTPFTLISNSKFPAGTSPGGMAFWPVDNSLLVTTSTGTILRYDLPTLTQDPTFASNLGNGQFKVKTGTQGGNPFAFVANNNGGDILEFSGPNQQGAPPVTNGVQHPQGLAVTNKAFQPFSTCSPGPCDLLGKKLITHKVPVNIGGNITEDVCVVQTDPRIAQCGSCTAAAQGNCPGAPSTTQYVNGLPVSQVCGAGFDNATKPIYIPNYLCGASGSTLSGFALAKTLTQAYKNDNSNPPSFPLNGTAIENDSLFPGMPDCSPGSPPPVLPVLAWAPLADEGAPLQGNDLNLLPFNSLREVTNGCGGGHSNGPTMSLWGIGFNVNQQVFANGLTDFANAKYATLLSTLNNAAYFQQPPLQPTKLPDGKGSNTQLSQCVSTSQLAFAAGNVDAALELLIADQYVVNNASNTSIFPPSGNYSPDPSGLVRALVENQYFTIDERINNGNPFPISTMPPVSPLPQSAIPPAISGTPLTHVSSGTFYSFTPTAAEFFGGNVTSTLTFSVLNAPPWAQLDPTTGKLFGTAQKGTFNNIMISVTDGCASATLTFNLKVTG